MTTRPTVRVGSIVAALLLAATAATTRPAAAAPRSLLLAGSQWSAGGNSSYAGWIHALRGDRLGRGWFLRPWLSYTTYRYRRGDITIHARAPGASLGVGYAWSDAAGARSLSLAPGYQDTRLRPDDPANDARGGRALLLVQGQWRQRLAGRWSLRVIANDALGPGNYWGRLRAARRLPGGLSVGPSVVRQGGPGYRAWQGGVFVRWPVVRRWHVELEGGYQKYAGLAGEGYAGLSVDLAY